MCLPEKNSVNASVNAPLFHRVCYLTNITFLIHQLNWWSNTCPVCWAVMSENGVRCFFRGKSNLKTVLESLRGVLLGIQCCQKIFSMAT